MMQFFEAIWSSLQSVFQFVKSIIEGIMTLIKLIPSVISTATQAIGYLPPIIAVFATLTITISVIYILVGRNTGSGGD